MSISVISSPDNIALAGNPIGYKLNSDNMFSVAGSQELVSLTIAAGLTPIENQTFSIAWTGQAAIVFTAKDSPDDLGFQIPTNPGATLTDEEYADELVKYFAQNYILFQAFDIYKFTFAGLWGVNIKFKKNQAISAAVVETLSNITYAITAGVTAVSNDLSIVVKLMVENENSAGDFNKIAECEYRPDENGDIDFDLSEMIRNELTLALPGYGVLDPSIAATLGWCRLFYIKTAEKLAQVYSGLVNTSQRRAIMGGLEWDKFIDYDVDDIHKRGAASYKYATWQPKEKTIAPTGKDYLYVFNYLVIGAGAMDVRLRADIIYKDGTSLLNEPIMANFTSYQYDLILIPSGRGQLTLPEPSPLLNPIVSYKLRLWHNDTNLALSEDFKYIIDRTYYENNNTFLFKNSVGVYETLWCHGYEEIAAEIRRSTAQKHVPTNYSAEDAENYQYDHNYQKIYSANTGTKSRLYIEHLLDLLMSDDVWIEGPELGDGGHWLPIKILTDKVNIREFAKFNSFLSFAWVYRFTNKNLDKL